MVKKLILLSIFSLCVGQEKDNGVHVSNVITINTPPVQRPGPKHPSVIEAHEKARRLAEDDFITCCCFFKIKKPR